MTVYCLYTKLLKFQLFNNTFSTNLLKFQQYKLVEIPTIQTCWNFNNTNLLKFQQYKLVEISTIQTCWNFNTLESDCCWILEISTLFYEITMVHFDSYPIFFHHQMSLLNSVLWKAAMWFLLGQTRLKWKGESWILNSWRSKRVTMNTRVKNLISLYSFVVFSDCVNCFCTCWINLHPNSNIFELQIGKWKFHTEIGKGFKVICTYMYTSFIPR